MKARDAKTRNESSSRDRRRMRVPGADEDCWKTCPEPECGECTEEMKAALRRIAEEERGAE